MRKPRLTDADKADIAARHEVVAGRVMAAEDLARRELAKPVADATKALVYQLAGESHPESIKRSMFRSVRALSEQLSDSASRAVETARGHARALADAQAKSDLKGFLKRAAEHGIAHAQPFVKMLPAASGAIRDQDGAIANQAGFQIGGKWSSQMLGTYVQWKRDGHGVDGLVRRLQGSASRGLEPVIETQSVTQSVDAFADQHAHVWADIAMQAAGSALSSEPAGWGAGLYHVRSAILDRKTCSVCFGLDGEMTPMGIDFADGRAPSHVRCRCCDMAVFLPQEAMASMHGIREDYAELKADVRSYMRGSSINIGEGRRHAVGFIADALSSSSSAALASRLSDRRAYFPELFRRSLPR